MTEQMGTPGSNADTSVNGGKGGAPKDKACPFCHQQFTSSSLGRHLDLYIKEKNPKPADGIHNVEEIRKMRGGITRRQPRNSASRREDSTPVGTPGGPDRRSPRPESERLGNRSPSLARIDGGPSEHLNFGRGKPSVFINRGTWENTGVMNNIPPSRPSDVRSWDGEDRDGGRRLEPRSRSVSKQMLAKTTFDQKQKIMDAQDNARAAELALRELLGSLRAAKHRVDGPQIFEYNPLSIDFPALTLHCLPPPPTLYSSTPVGTPTSWSIQPPDDTQYQALREHFSTAFHNWRIACAIATTAPKDDLSYPPPPANFDDASDVAQRAEAEAAELEAKISEHLHRVFAQWNSLPQAKRSEIWVLELARSVGRKSEEVKTLKREKEYSIQEKADLKHQVDELSRLQYPKEFKMLAPRTIPIDGQLMNELGERGVQNNGIGFILMDRNIHIDAVVERAIGRWKDVVKEARGGGGLAGQRSLSGESCVPPISTNITPNPSININHTNPVIVNDNPVQANGDMGSDQDADADMEEDETYEMTDAPSRAPDCAIPGSSSTPAATNFRLGNGSVGGSNGRMEGMESQVVQGYVRIGA